MERTAHRTAERAQLPVEDPDHAVLRGVEDEVVELVVPVDDPEARLALVGQVRAVPREHLGEPRDVARLLPRFDVHRLRLCGGDGREGLDLPRKVWGVAGEVQEAELRGGQKSERCEYACCGEPAGDGISSGEGNAAGPKEADVSGPRARRSAHAGTGNCWSVRIDDA